MSRRRRAENPVSLFPFVAVMASTMGALILLLLVTARQASKARDASWLQKQRAAVELPTLPPLPGKTEFPKLKPLPPHELPRLVERPLPELPPVTDPRTAMFTRLKQIERELAELRRKRERVPQPGEERLAPLTREAALLRDRLQQILEDRRKQQAAMRHSKANADELAAEKDRADQRRRLSTHKYALTPYFGPNATNRRPIYLECTADAVVLRPEGVSVSTASLENDARADNPLAQLVHAVAELRDRRTGEPSYPLLVVRPNGVRTYYTARHALEFLRFPFGYELVGADQELAFPDSDVETKRAAETALLRANQQRQVAESPTLPRNGRGDGGRQRSSSNVVPAVIPSEGAAVGSEQPIEIGASVRDYIVRRHGVSGQGRGLGALSAAAPTPFTPFDAPSRASAGNARRRDRSQAKVDSQLERPQPSLSERLQQFVEGPPLPKTGGRPQTQQWRPGLEGLEPPSASAGENSVSRPEGVWEPKRQRPKRRPTQDESATNGTSPTSVGAQLSRAANPPAAERDADPFGVSSPRIELAPRSIQVEVRASSVVSQTGTTISLADDDESPFAAAAVAGACFAEVERWPTPPPGKQWRPSVLLLVRSGASPNAYRLRAALTSLGIAVAQIWIDDHGAPSLLPAWGME